MEVCIMRTFFCIVLYCFMIFSMDCFAEEVRNFDDAVILSKSSGKKIFLYFGAEWCVYCTKMNNLFYEKDVSERLDKFIVLKLDKDIETGLVEKFSVKSIPDYMILDSKENILKRDKGYKTKSNFLLWLK